MIESFRQLVNSPKTQSFLESGISLYDHQDYPFLSYIGVDYLGQDFLALKLYMHGYRKLSMQEIAPLFPETSLIEEAYEKFEETIYSKDTVRAGKHPLDHMGTLFKFKITTDDRLSHTFFVRLPDYDQGPIQELELPEAENPSVDDYFCCESEGESVLYKRYYPIENPINRQFMKEHLGLSDIDLDDLLIMEYLEYENRKKVALNFKEDRILKYIDPSAKPLVEYLAKYHGLTPVGLGRCVKSNVRSLYFKENSFKRFFKDSFTFHRLVKR